MDVERLKSLPQELRKGAYRSDLLGWGRPLLATDSRRMMAVVFFDCIDALGHLRKDHPAATWVPRFDTYSEVTVDGRGVALWLYASHNLGGETERTGTLGDGSVVTIYRSHPFMPLTGQRLIERSAIVEHCDQTLNSLYQEVFGVEDAKAHRDKPSPPRWRQPWRNASPLPPSTLPPTPRAKKKKKDKKRIDEAKDFLWATLRDCARPYGWIIAAAGDRHITLITLRRAKKDMRVLSTRRRFQGKVLWTIYPLSKRGRS